MLSVKSIGWILNEMELPSRKVVLCFSLGFVLTWTSGSARTADFGSCHQAYARSQQSWDAAHCFYQEARSSGRKEEARAQVGGLVRQDPSNPNLKLVLAYLEPVPDRKERLYNEALNLYSEQDDLGGELRTLDSMWNFFRRDRLPEALDVIERMERLVATSADPLFHARVVLVKVRHLFEVEKDFAGARNQLLGLVDFLPTQGSEPLNREQYRLRQRFFRFMGRSHFELGMAERAFGYFAQEAELAESYEEPRDLEIALGNMLVALRDQMEESSDPVERRHAIETVREILERAKERNLLEATLLGLLLLGDLVQGEEAQSLYRECVEQSSGKFRTCRLRLAVHQAISDPEGALSSLQTIRAELPRSPDPLDATYDALNEIRVPWAARDYDRAWEESVEAIDIIENLRDLQERDFGRTRSFAAWASTYSWLTGRLLELYQQRQSAEDLDRAFEVGERLRARMLLDILGTMHSTPSESPELQARRNELREILSKRNELQYEIRSGLRRDSESEKEILDLLEKERIARGTISLISGRFAEVERPTFAKIDEVQNALLPHEALLVFQLSPDRSAFETFAGGSWLSLITADSVNVYRLEDGNEISKRARLLSDLLEQGRSARPLGVRLYQDLVAEGLNDLSPEVTDLILIPDKMLHRFPLAVLRPAEDAAPLGAQYRISRIPSATLWLQNWRKSELQTTPTKPALVIADPSPDNRTTKYDASLVGNGIESLDADQGNSLFRTTYGELPFAKQEGWSIRRQLGPHTEMLVGAAASESALKSMSEAELLERFSILHFAAHAISNEAQPDHSGIVLTPDRDGSGGNEALNDGILEFNEIVDLGFAGRAIVLSTCHSARGQILRGEGVFDLARAFFEGGARAVVGSLWRLEDRATAHFFDDFYRHLAKGTSLSEALHLAQKDQIGRGIPPSAWAGIVVIGDGSLVPFPDRNGRHHPGWVVLVALVLLTLAVAVAARRAG